MMIVTSPKQKKMSSSVSDDILKAKAKKEGITKVDNDINLSKTLLVILMSSIHPKTLLK